MTDIVTKKPMALGTVQIPVGTALSGVPEDAAKLLASRGLAEVKGSKPESKHPKKEKTEVGF